MSTRPASIPPVVAWAVAVRDGCGGWVLAQPVRVCETRVAAIQWFGALRYAAMRAGVVRVHVVAVEPPEGAER